MAAATLGLCCSCGQKHSIVANIDGWGNDTILVEYYFLSDDDEDINKTDTLIARNGQIEFNIDVPEDDLCFVYINRINEMYKNGVGYPTGLKAKTITLILEKDDKLKIKGTAQEDRVFYTATGTKFNSDQADARNLYMDYTIKLDSIEKIIELVDDSEEMLEIKGAFLTNIRNVKLEYIKNNPDTDLAAFFTTDVSVINFNKAYSLLGENAKNGMLKQFLEYYKDDADEYEQIQKNYARVSEGNIAPGFTLKSITGEDISLEDFKGKWVVLDFWYTDCGWCIKGMPKMQEAYDKYKDRIEMISICKDKEEAWKTSVKKHSLGWMQLLDNDEVYINYAVEYFPTKFIIDPNGVIAYNNHGESADFYETLDQLLN